MGDIPNNILGIVWIAIGVPLWIFLGIYFDIASKKIKKRSEKVVRNFLNGSVHLLTTILLTTLPLTKGIGSFLAATAPLSALFLSIIPVQILYWITKDRRTLLNNITLYLWIICCAIGIIVFINLQAAQVLFLL